MIRSIKISVLTSVLALLNLCVIAQEKKWTQSELDSANTGQSIDYLTDLEKECIQYLNLARMHPVKFKEIVLDGYEGTKKYGPYLKGSTYIETLKLTLDSIGPLPRLFLDSALTENATCFAKEIGESGYTGHERQNCPKEKYSECISFGMSTAKDIVLQMLIDHNITNLGHRKYFLSGTIEKVGISFHPHKEWGECCVFEFY